MILKDNMKSYPFRYIYYSIFLCWKDTNFLCESDFFLKSWELPGWAPLLRVICFWYIVICCISSENIWFNKLTFIFWRKRLIKPGKEKPLKDLLSFLQHVIERECQAICHCYQLNWIKPLWARIQYLAESLWQVLIGAINTPFAEKISMNI